MGGRERANERGRGPNEKGVRAGGREPELRSGPALPPSLPLHPPPSHPPSPPSSLPPLPPLPPYIPSLSPNLPPSSLPLLPSLPSHPPSRAKPGNRLVFNVNVILPNDSFSRTIPNIRPDSHKAGNSWCNSVCVYVCVFSYKLLRESLTSHYVDSSTG